MTRPRALALPALVLALGAAATPARAAAPPRLSAVSADGAQALRLHWSRPVRLGRGPAARAFRVRSGGRAVPVRGVSRTARPAVLRLRLVRAARGVTVRYLGASRLVRGTDGRVARTATVTVPARTASRPAPKPTPKPAPTPGPTPKPAPTPAAPPSPSPTGGNWTTLSHPTDPAQLDLMPFGGRSFWLQPWRAYLQTVPGSTLRDAVGINFNLEPDQAERTAALLAAAGVRRARVEFGWDQMRYDDPGTLANPGRMDAILGALHAHGIRPLILLNANHGAPGPVRWLSLTTAAPAAAGDRTVRLDAASAAAVVPGRTGFNALDGSYKAADIIVTAVDGAGTATLSKPLTQDLPAGAHPAATLRYAPFAPPLNADGTPNASFEDTLAGWLRYVGAVTAEARTVIGSDAFDVEVWNELNFGSDFLDAGRYYDPVPPALSGRGDVTQALLERTVAWLRDPAHGVAGVGIGDGFASQTPWVSGATEVPGVTAIDKHPYAAPRVYPSDTQWNTQPLDVLGRGAGWAPAMRAFFPEYWLTGLQTETLIRDLAPQTTSVYGTPHGRDTHPAGAPAPQMWLTEMGLPLDDPRLPQADLTAAAKRHILTKGVLRTLVSYVNKGVTAVDFYAARDAVYGLVDDSFFQGAGAGGETTDALGRLLAPFDAAQPISRPRALTLDAVAEQDGRAQFAGDGTSANPPLYDRDVTAVLPFQLSDTKFAIPAYVMTRDLAHAYAPGAPRSDVTRWDMPPETFRLTLGGLSPATTFTASDPLTGATVPVDVVSRTAGEIVIQLPLTDSPRTIIADEG